MIIIGLGMYLFSSMQPPLSHTFFRSPLACGDTHRKGKNQGSFPSHSFPSTTHIYGSIIICFLCFLSTLSMCIVCPKLVKWTSLDYWIFYFFSEAKIFIINLWDHFKDVKGEFWEQLLKKLQDFSFGEIEIHQP